LNGGKHLYLILVVLFCSLLTLAAGTYLGYYYKNANKSVNKIATKYVTEEDTFDKFSLIDTYSELLYDYKESNYGTISEFLKAKDNNYKLAIAGVTDNVTFSELKNKLETDFGSSFDIEPEDYYVYEGDELPKYLYNSETDTYTLNNNYIEAVGLTKFKLLNYRLDSIEYLSDKINVVYYGMYYDNIFTVNNSNSYYNLNEVSLDDLYVSNKDEFMKFTYTFTKSNDNYILTNLKVGN